jgi:hypothetical protein
MLLHLKSEFKLLLMNLQIFLEILDASFGNMSVLAWLFKHDL